MFSPLEKIIVTALTFFLLLTTHGEVPSKMDPLNTSAAATGHSYDNYPVKQTDDCHSGADPK